MTTQNALREKEATTAAPARPATTPLEDLVDRVQRDSREDAQEYLDETTVPHGGE